jgi:hypothetical protein
LILHLVILQPRCHMHSLVVGNALCELGTYIPDLLDCMFHRYQVKWLKVVIPGIVFGYYAAFGGLVNGRRLPRTVRHIIGQFMDAPRTFVKVGAVCCCADSFWSILASSGYWLAAAERLAALEAGCWMLHVSKSCVVLDATRASSITGWIGNARDYGKSGSRWEVAASPAWAFAVARFI